MTFVTNEIIPGREGALIYERVLKFFLGTPLCARLRGSHVPSAPYAASCTTINLVTALTSVYLDLCSHCMSFAREVRQRKKSCARDNIVTS